MRTVAAHVAGDAATAVLHHARRPPTAIGQKVETRLPATARVAVLLRPHGRHVILVVEALM